MMRSVARRILAPLSILLCCCGALPSARAQVPYLVADIALGEVPKAVGPTQVFSLGGQVLFSENGNLWATDGTPNGTRQFLATQCPDSCAGGFGLMASSGSVAFLSTVGNLWRTDGTTAGTFQLTFDPIVGAHGTYEQEVGPDGVFYFEGCTVASCQPWRSDGTLAGT